MARSGDPMRSAALAAVLAAVMAGQGMAEPLIRPATVPLEFLGWTGHDADWLIGVLTEQGFGAAVEAGKDGLVVTSTEALRAANRIRTFAHLAAPGIRSPYFDLMIAQPKGGPERCITLFPRSVVPELGPMDFAREDLSAEGADPVAYDLCRVRPELAEAFAGISRQEFRDRYFDAAGDLRSDFLGLNTDQAFLAAAFDFGFFVKQGDVTGRIRLDPE